MDIDEIGPCFYHGCDGDTGHYLWRESGGRTCIVTHDFPVPISTLDSGFLPPNAPQEEGLATLAHVNGWTILAFWDRSIDGRGNSNSAFVIPALIYNLDVVKQLAEKRFPWIWRRFKFEVRARQ